MKHKHALLWPSSFSSTFMCGKDKWPDVTVVRSMGRTQIISKITTKCINRMHTQGQCHLWNKVQLPTHSTCTPFSTSNNISEQHSAPPHPLQHPSSTVWTAAAILVFNQYCPLLFLNLQTDAAFNTGTWPSSQQRKKDQNCDCTIHIRHSLVDDWPLWRSPTTHDVTQIFIFLNTQYVALSENIIFFTEWLPLSGRYSRDIDNFTQSSVHLTHSTNPASVFHLSLTLKLER
jgi:hypothetical protein